MHARYGKQMHAWPALIGELRQAISENISPNDPRAQQLATRWMELFCAYAGNDPATHARIREAYAAEPELRNGSVVDDTLLGYIRRAIESTKAGVR